MKAPVKIGIATALGVIAVPSAVVSSRASYAAEARKVHDTLSKTGYSKKNPNKLADFNKNRETYNGGNFALGCHRLLFGGKNLRRLPEISIGSNDNWVNTDPMNDYLDKDKSQPVFGCSTAAPMKWESEDVYEFELAIKRGNIGFLERVTVWKNSNKAVSQLVVYKKNEDSTTQSQHSWVNWYAIQRIMNKENFEIGNPKNKSWSDLTIDGKEINKPKYFTVWIDDPRGKGILDNLGIRSKSNKTLFSSLAKAKTYSDWAFKFFPAENQSKLMEINKSAHGGKNKATYTSLMAEEVAGFKGMWKDVNEFCGSSQYKKLTNIDKLRDYCYEKQKSNTKAS